MARATGAARQWVDCCPEGEKRRGGSGPSGRCIRGKEGARLGGTARDLAPVDDVDWRTPAVARSADGTSSSFPSLTRPIATLLSRVESAVERPQITGELVIRRSPPITRTSGPEPAAEDSSFSSATPSPPPPPAEQPPRNRHAQRLFRRFISTVHFDGGELPRGPWPGGAS
jgi:hypothetical protein